mgnify:FL=1
MKIADLMTPSVDLVDPSMSIREAAARMRDGDVGALPVGENDRLVGMVTDRDIAVRGVAGDKAPGECQVHDVMSGGVYYCFEEDDAEQGAQTMGARRVRRLPILNGDKRRVGVLSIADLARAGHGQTALGAVSEPTPAHRA